MKKSLKKIFGAAIRIFVISFLITFLLMSLAKCSIEQTDETVTILSYSANNDNFVLHLNDNIPVKVIATDSNTDVSADIVYFPTDAIYEEYKANFTELESIRICNVGCIYVTDNVYNKLGTSWSFNNIIRIIENDESIIDIWSNRDITIKLDIDLSSKEAPAFLELLFNYYSSGTSYNDLSEEDRLEVISKMKNFISKNESIENSEPVYWRINGGIKSSAYTKVLPDTSGIVSERLVAISEHGKKYIEDIKEEYFIENGTANCKVISSLPNSIIKEFSSNSFDYELNTKFDFMCALPFYGLGILLGVVFIAWACCLLDGSDELWLLALYFFVATALIIGILISKSYSIAFIITVIWFLLDINFNKFYGLGQAFNELKVSRENKKAKELEKELKAKEILEQYGEGNVGTYKDVCGKVDEMINFCKELEVDDSVWQEIKSFIEDKPKSISIMKNIIDDNVRFMLMIYSSLSDIKKDEEKVIEVKELLVGVNEVVAEDFEDKKQLYYGEVNACIKHIKANLQGRIKY